MKIPSLVWVMIGLLLVVGIFAFVIIYTPVNYDMPYSGTIGINHSLCLSDNCILKNLSGMRLK